MHRKFQKKRVIFRSWEACTISRPFFRSFLCKTAPRRPHLKNKSKPVRDRLAHAPLKTAREKNCILAHMWPLSRRAPRSREAAAVCLADKLCATAEIMQIWRNLGLRRAVLSGA